PAIVNAKSISSDLFDERVKGLFGLMILCGLVVALPTSILSGWVVSILFGDSFSEAGSVLAVHIWVGLFISLGMAASKWFVVENLQKLFLYRTLTGLVVNFFLNLILIPPYGVVGAAVSTLISVV